MREAAIFRNLFAGNSAAFPGLCHSPPPHDAGVMGIDPPIMVGVPRGSEITHCERWRGGCYDGRT